MDGVRMAAVVLAYNRLNPVRQNIVRELAAMVAESENYSDRENASKRMFDLLFPQEVESEVV